ncbi:protein SSUH2 homolog isoform X2 [Hyla sarda]|uniref:protein SSUH2 homolog isoform X2 n=1 Tax=Hyla sarda TaxID=327740 RepID=UPI0024C46368|nr:protein SSUH2 homolog isoform X2 [Hyla sarda]
MEQETSMTDHCTPCNTSNGDPQDYRNVPLITEDAVRDALRKYVLSSYCCCRPRSEEPVIERLTQLPLYRYRLATFTEKRHIEKISKPYTGQRIEAPEREPALQLWDINVCTPKMFHEGSKKCPLPQSGEIKTCLKCGGRGRCKCSRCGGSGQFRCGCSNNRRQRSRNKRCPSCSGSGRRRCGKCSGRGKKVCTSCKGEGRLLYYQQLSVKWKTLYSEAIADPHDQESSLPVILLQKVTGKMIMMDDEVLVHPLAGCPDVAEISAASERLIQEHQNTCGPLCHILRQTVEMIPVVQVQYEYNGKNLSCLVYGQELRVYSKRSLHRFTLSCSVM